MRLRILFPRMNAHPPRNKSTHPSRRKCHLLLRKFIPFIFSTWSHNSMIMYNPLLCTPSCPVIRHASDGADKPSNAKPTLCIIIVFGSCKGSRSIFAGWGCRVFMICPEPQRRMLGLTVFWNYNLSRGSVVLSKVRKRLKACIAFHGQNQN